MKIYLYSQVILQRNAHRAAACAVSNPPTQIYPNKTISSVFPSNFPYNVLLCPSQINHIHHQKY